MSGLQRPISFLSRILAGCSVSVRVGLKGRGIDDSLVVHQLVILGVCKSEQLVVMVQFDGIGTTSTEGVTRVERVDEGQVIHERLDVRRGFFEASPLASPHFHHVVPFRSKQVDFLLGLFVHIPHGPITVAHMFFVTVGITVGTPVDETTLKFVHGLGVWAVAIHEELGTGDAILAGIADMLNEITLTGMRVVRGSQGLLTLLVITPG